MALTSLLQHPYATVLARLVLAIVLLAAGLHKLPDRRRFYFVVLTFDVLPRPLARIYASALPWFETAAGIMLLLGIATRLAGILAFLLLVSFTAAIVLNVTRGRTDIDCGCFGSKKRHGISRGKLVQNSVLLALAAIVAVSDSHQLALAGLLPSTVLDGPQVRALDSLFLMVVVSVITFLGLPLVRRLSLSWRAG